MRALGGRTALYTALAVASLTLGVACGAHVDKSADPTSTSGTVAFERRLRGGPWEIWLMSDDGSHQRRLTRGHDIDWSRDARQIAFVDEGGAYVIAVDGAARRRIGPATAEASGLNWSPEGKRIAVAADKGILVINLDSGRSVNVTSGRRDLYPRWSPNGKRIVFERELAERGHIGNDLFIVNADGSRLRRLTHDLGHDSASWAPGGKLIAYRGWADFRNSDIYVMKADGSDQRNITNTPRREESPVWSPGGRRLLFAQYGLASNIPGVFTIHRDGRRFRRLAQGASHSQWSPDGQSIVYARRRVRNQSSNADIWVMSAWGRDQRNLTRSSPEVHNTAPLWAPVRR